MLQCIHLAHTDEMKGKLVELAGKLWDSWGKQMDAFWDSNLCHPWDCWSICDFDLALCTPSNQVQESWHNQILKARIPGMFKGSTESVIKVALAQLVRMDGYFMPTVLPFHVSPPSILAPFLAIERGCHKSSLFCRCLGCRRGCLRRRCGMCGTARPTFILLRRPTGPSSIMC